MKTVSASAILLVLLASCVSSPDPQPLSTRTETGTFTIGKLSEFRGVTEVCFTVPQDHEMTLRMADAMRAELPPNLRIRTDIPACDSDAFFLAYDASKGGGSLTKGVIGDVRGIHFFNERKPEEFMRSFVWLFKEATKY